MFGPAGQLGVGYAVAIDGPGNVVVGGADQAHINLGGGASSTTGAFLGKFGPSGSYLWSKAPGGESVRFIAIDGSESVVAAGTFLDSVDWGGSTLTNTAGTTEMLFVVKLDASGNHVWSQAFGDGTNPVALDSMVLDGAGGILLAGTYTNSTVFGGTTISPSDGTMAGSFLVELDAETGNPLWSKGLPSTENVVAVVDKAGNIDVSGSFEKSINLGGGALMSNGGYDLFVAQLDGNGNHLWSKSFGGSGDDGAGELGVDAAGDLVLTGSTTSGLNFNGSVMPSGSTFIVKLSSQGNLAWSTPFTGGVQVESLAVDGAGNIFAAGAGSGSVGFAGGSVPQGDSGIDLMVVKISASGRLLWGQRSTGVNSAANMIAVNASDSVAIAGSTRSGSVNLGTGNLSCSVFCPLVYRLAP